MEPFDFLAELVQHIPNKGEHLIRYYGYYSNKARGLRAKNADPHSDELNTQQSADAQAQPIISEPARLDRRRWAILIKHIYQADPLLCPKCGGTMKVIAFIEAHQVDLISKILKHCGLWNDPPPRAPPKPLPPSKAVRSIAESVSDSGLTHEIDPDFLEHLHREEIEQPELPWEP